MRKEEKNDVESWKLMVFCHLHKLLLDAVI